MIKVTAETRLADLAVEIKDRNDKLTLVTKEISTLSSFLAVTSDERREIAAQERDTQKLTDQYSRDLQKVKYEQGNHTVFLCGAVLNGQLIRDNWSKSCSFSEISQFLNGIFKADFFKQAQLSQSVL